MSEDIEIRDNSDKSRYEALVDGAVAGYAEYERVNGLVAFTHTVVEKEYGGRGVGSTLVRQSLEDVRGQNLTVRPVCPFYQKYIEDHPEYADLLGT